MSFGQVASHRTHRTKGRMRVSEEIALIFLLHRRPNHAVRTKRCEERLGALRHLGSLLAFLGAIWA
jgi:hypothetical protein